MSQTAAKQDPPKQEDKNTKSAAANGKIPEPELSEEDQALKDGLELAIERLGENDNNLHRPSLEHLMNEIRSSTSSMTAVPKPLKFLRPHYGKLKGIYESWPVTHELKKLLCDVLSVLAMTMSDRGSRESLSFKLKGTRVDISSWGHEYVRSLAGEISEEYNQRLLDVTASTEDLEVGDLMVLVEEIIPFQMQHNSEAEAIDLLIEVQQLEKLTLPSLKTGVSMIDERNYQRVCLYLIRLADYMADAEDYNTVLEVTYSIYKQQKKYIDALRVAMKLDDEDKLNQLFDEATEVPEVELKQMAFILARHHSHFTVTQHSQVESLNDIIGNIHLSERFLQIATAMDLTDPKAPEDIFKTNLVNGGRRGLNSQTTASTDSARANLASSIVNAFVNAGFNKDKLLLGSSEEGAGSDNTATGASNWVFKNKDHGMISAVASIGMMLLWNVDEGFNQIDKYFHQHDNNIKAGACLGVGIVSANVRSESDAAFAILSDFLVESPGVHQVKINAILGLGIAYAGTRRVELQEQLLPFVCNATEGPVMNGMNNIIEASFASLALGLIFTGTCNDDISGSIIQRLLESTEAELNHPMSRYLVLGMGLLYLGKQDKVDVVLEAVRAVDHVKTSKFAEVMLDICAFAGTGNVLKIQGLLRQCAEHITPPPAAPAAATEATAAPTATPAAATNPLMSLLSGAKPSAANAGPDLTIAPSCVNHQSLATLGIALISLGEEISTEMTLRTLDHLQHYCDIGVKRVIPLALALLYISYPDYSVIDQLSRLSHDQDPEIAQSAIFGLGLVSAGTNNSRVSGLLRQLAEFYSKEADHLFVVRLAQGLNAMGKGLLTLSPFHSDRLLMHGPGLGAILAVLVACLEMKASILDKYHYLLYVLTVGINPRVMQTVDTDLQPIQTTVRVGQAVETVGQAGRPKTITGFQTHTTPVLLGYKDRAELATKEYISVASVMEQVVILQKNLENSEDNVTAGSTKE